MPQPGWYPSPDDPAKLAFWDGAKWTGETMDDPSSAPALSRRELRLRRSEEAEGASMAFPTWEQRPEAAQVQPEPVHVPEATPIEAVAEVAGYTLGDGTVVEPVNPVEAPQPYIFDEPLPDDLAAALDVASEPEPQVEVFAGPEPLVVVPTEAVQYPTVASPVPTEVVQYPTVAEPVPTEAVVYPTVVEPLPSAGFTLPVDDSAWSRDDEPVTVEGTDDEFDAVLGVKPAKVKKEKAPKEPREKRVRERKTKLESDDADELLAASPKSEKGWRQRGVKSGLVVAVIGIVLALVGILLVPALLDPTPAGGAVQAGEQRASAVVRELNVDVDGYCHPTVEVATGFGSFEVLALKLHELNTACPVKIGEQVTVYFEPNSGDDARYVRAGTIPVDLIMWSVFGAGMLGVAWGLLRAWATRKNMSIPLVTLKS